MKFQRKNLLACAVLAVACVTGIGTSQAGVTMYTSQASFSAAGNIAYNSTFTDHTGMTFISPDFYLAGDPYTLGGVTYTSPPQTGDTNLIVGPATAYAPPTYVLSSNNYTPITGNIDTAPKYDMFGYNIGAFGAGGLQTLNVITNVTTYSFGPLSITTTGLEFRGFITTSPTEYFTGFAIIAQIGGGSLPGITNVQVGNTGVRPEGVPEPGSLIVFGALGAIGMVVGYRRKQVA